MYYHFILVPVVVGLIIVYARARKRNDLKRVAIVQPLGSFLEAVLVAGALLIYLGDLEYGIHRFRKPIPMHFGPYCYLGGQLLIALSPSCAAFP